MAATEGRVDKNCFMTYDLPAPGGPTKVMNDMQMQRGAAAWAVITRGGRV